MRSLSVLLLAVVCTSRTLYAQLPDSIAGKVDAIFARFDKTNSPGCMLAILKDGKMLYSRGYGMSNMEYNIAISGGSIFHVASISKQFTAAAIQKLALEGKLSLSDDIRKYVPEAPDLGHTITLAHLIHHTSGLRDQWDLQALQGWREDDLVTEGDILATLKRQEKLNFAPGTEYNYCNTGFTLLGLVVKKVTGVSLRAYADSVIFKPLGMNSTHFHSDHAEITPNRTQAYYQDDVSGKWKISIPVFDNYGATSLFTTVGDLAKWDENFYTRQVGGDAFVKAMITPGIFNDGKLQNYASGIVIGSYKGNAIQEHSGADAGYRANFLRFPDQHFSVIVLANVANINTGNLSRMVADLFIPDRTAVGQESGLKADEKWAGDYMDFHTRALMKVAVKDGKLLVYGSPLQTVSDSVYADPNSGGRYNFNTGGVSLTTPGMQDRSAQKIVMLKQAAPADLASYVGTYYSRELDVKYMLTVKDTVLYVTAPRNEPFEMTPLIRDFFVGQAFVQFIRDKRGRVTGFAVSTRRAWDIYFEKIK